ncbi:hypothetical protein VULLAG_LOCUS6198 [Vulpes lagopus]
MRPWESDRGCGRRTQGGVEAPRLDFVLPKTALSLASRRTLDPIPWLAVARSPWSSCKDGVDSRWKVFREF